MRYFRMPLEVGHVCTTVIGRAAWSRSAPAVLALMPWFAAWTPICWREVVLRVESAGRVSDGSLDTRVGAARPLRSPGARGSQGALFAEASVSSSVFTCRIASAKRERQRVVALVLSEGLRFESSNAGIQMVYDELSFRFRERHGWRIYCEVHRSTALHLL